MTALCFPLATKESDDAKVRLGSRFHRLFGATLVSAIGTGMHAATLPLLTLQSTSSPIALSLVVVAAVIPWVLVSLHAGVVVDRLGRRRVMVRLSVRCGTGQRILWTEDWLTFRGGNR